ncbi:MAG: cobalt-precorrin-5B (C(1))-methyltransferase CbiD [Candidatus Adiutrix sp.]
MADSNPKVKKPNHTHHHKGKALRSGFTTGTAATAAAIAAGLILSGQPCPKDVTVKLPSGADLVVSVARGYSINPNEAMATVIKDGGDDPDVTNGAEIGAFVRRTPAFGLIQLLGGRGVGRVTKPGLAVECGQWAINPSPRRMLMENMNQFLTAPTVSGLEVEIFVENGEEIALKTLNPRLGIVGGISILGTSGLVKPFSHEAYIATVESALDVAVAAGLTEIIFTTGRQSEKAAIKQRPNLPLESFVQIADFFADSLILAKNRPIKTIGLAVFFGKAVKQALGHANTHAHKNPQDTITLAQWLGEGDMDLTLALSQAMTARASLDILRQRGQMSKISLVAQKALAAARSFTGPVPKLWMTIFDFDTTAIVFETLN